MRCSAGRELAQCQTAATDELALGIIPRQARTVDIAPIMNSCGYDWLFLDLEHNSMDLDTAVQIAVAALAVGIAPVARVPAGQLWLATCFLEVARSGLSRRMSQAISQFLSLWG